MWNDNHGAAQQSYFKNIISRGNGIGFRDHSIIAMNGCGDARDYLRVDNSIANVKNNNRNVAMNIRKIMHSNIRHS